MSKHLFKIGPAKRAWSVGLLWNPHALWLGVHYSPMNRRHCINLVPCLTVWVRLPGGKEP